MTVSTIYDPMPPGAIIGGSFTVVGMSIGEYNGVTGAGAPYSRTIALDFSLRWRHGL